MGGFFLQIKYDHVTTRGPWALMDSRESNGKVKYFLLNVFPSWGPRGQLFYLDRLWNGIDPMITHIMFDQNWMTNVEGVVLI